MDQVEPNIQPWADLCSKLEELVVNGNHEECRRILDSCSPKKIPQPWAVRVADLASRVNLPPYALKTLRQIIYPKSSFDSVASDKEKMIYATALFKLGAINDSIEILQKINPEKEPEALFYKANAGFYNWNYEDGIPLLQKYIESPQITPYRRLVAKVNLSAALISVEDWSATRALLDEIRLECETHSYQLLLGNCYELMAQVELFQGKYDQALEFLDKSLIYLKEQGGLYSLFAEKWMIICRYQKSKNKEELQKLDSLRTKAIEFGHHSTVRECDLFEAILTKDEQLLKKVIMGTPSESYRKRARKLFGKNIPARGQYFFQVGDSLAKMDGTPFPVFDARQGTFNGKQLSEALYKKPRLLSLFNALTQDFYQTQTLGNLFQKIYEDEKFNPDTSPARVLQLLQRLDNWFIKNQLPLRVLFKKSEFKITSLENVCILIQRSPTVLSSEGNFLALKTHFHQRTFSAAKVMEALKISKTTSNKLLREALTAGVLVKMGEGRATIYRLANPKEHQKAKKVA